MDEDLDDEEERTKCQICVSGCKQMTTFTLSHVGLLTLVICYCTLGAAIFEKLEAENELNVKSNMTLIRLNVSHELWDMTDRSLYIDPELWVSNARKKLAEFEDKLIDAIKNKGWDGKEEHDVQSWTFVGSLFYSIIVITTIGYGHIAPKTMWGKICTIFYAIVGIPLMVICWSHIGDFMANAFRCLYWKVCCYICTRNPRPRRRDGTRIRRSVRGSSRGGSIRMRKSIRRQRASQSQRSADSAISDSVASIASDPGMTQLGTMRSQRQQSYNPPPPPSHHASTLPRTGHSHQLQPQPLGSRSQRTTKSAEPELYLTAASLKNLPVLYNRYAEDIPPRHGKGIITTQPIASTQEDIEEDDELEEPKHGKSKISRNRLSRMRSVPPELEYGPSRIEEGYFEDDDVYEEYDDDDFDRRSGGAGYDRRTGYRRQVPIWLCAFLVVGYIVGGGFLFSSWEGWEYLDSAYFCFITLTTIGFGDFVPAQNLPKGNEVTSIALCSLYLLFGIALLAMSFNLVQEQVINAFKELAMRLGIIPDEEEEQY